MGLRCPSCGFDSADSAPWCDFCKEPFRKKPKAAAPSKPTPTSASAPTPDPLDGLSKESLHDLPPEQLLKPQNDIPKLPPWLRPLAWTFFVVWLAAGALALHALHSHYRATHKLTGTEPQARP